MIRTIMAMLLLVVGVAFIVIASIGVARLPDVFQRMHASTKAGGIGTSLVVIGVIFTRKEQPPVATTTAVPSGTAVTSTAVAPMAPNEGVLLLSASPWADINSIVSTSDNRPMAFDEKSTPARIELPPGQYEITLIDDQGRARKEQVTIQGGEPTRVKVDMGTVNVDELYREVTKP